MAWMVPPPRREAAPGLWACESGPASLAEMRAAASARVASGKQNRDWTGRSPRCLAVFLTSWGSSLPSALLAGGRAGAGGAWHWDPGLSESRESPPCRSAGEEGLRQRPLAPPSPVEESTHRHFRRRSGCLVLDWFDPCCQRDSGEESGRPRWGRALLACPDRGAHRFLPLVCTLLASPARPVGPSSPALCSRQGWFVTNSLSAWHGVRVTGEHSRWQTTPNCSALPGNTPGRALSVICGARTRWKPSPR